MISFFKKKEKVNPAMIVENNPNPVTEVDFDGKIFYANPAAKKLFPDLSTSNNHPWLAEMSRLAPELKKKGRTSVKFCLGERCYQQSLAYCSASGRVRIYGIDITEQEAKEKALTAKLSFFLEEARDANRELKKKLEELNRFKELMMGREFKMIEMKKELVELKKKFQTKNK